MMSWPPWNRWPAGSSAVVTSTLVSWWEVNAPRRLAFGVAADEYDLIRPGYPAPLVDAVLAHCGGPGVTAVEAGAGTGKATRAFAARGLAITAVEPDPAMAGILAASCAGYPWVSVVGGGFEAYVPARPCGLLFS